MKLPSKEVFGLTLFFALMVGSLVVVLVAAGELPSGVFSLIRHVVTEMEAFVVFAGALAYGATEGGDMIAESFKKKREQKGREEGRAESRAEIAQLIREKAKNGTVDVEEILRAIE